MIAIRQYRDSDKEYLRKICIETSKLPIETKKQRDFLCLAFNDYYTEVEGENCFVAVNEKDEPVGYILCAENFDRYFKIMKKFYLPDIRKLGLNHWLMIQGEIAVHRAFSKKYPAHLHIDILDVCQGQGVGTRLMNELKEHLKSKGIHQLMLSCGESNRQAVAFYKKNGFQIIKKLAGSCIMACEF